MIKKTAKKRVKSKGYFVDDTCKECGARLFRFNHNSEFDSLCCMNFRCDAHHRPVKSIRIAPPKEKPLIFGEMIKAMISEKLDD